MITSLWPDLTENTTPTKTEPTEKLDMLLNPEKAMQRNKDKERVIEDIRDDAWQNIVQYCFSYYLTSLPVTCNLNI